MSTKIERIKITELDTTEAARAEDSLDVVYVPGLYGIKYTVVTADYEPSSPEDDGNYAQVGDTYMNLADKRAWVCDEKETVEEKDQPNKYRYHWNEITFNYPAIAQFDNRGEFDIDATIDILDQCCGDELVMMEPYKCLSESELGAAFGTKYYNNDFGDSITYALGILHAGLPVIYHCGLKFVKVEGNAVCYTSVSTADDMFKEMNLPVASNESCFHAVLDKSTYDVKYITSGVYSAGEPEEIQDAASRFAYPNIMLNMINLCALRGDAFALIDCGKTQTIKTGSLYDNLVAEFGGGVTNGEYAGAFAPWAHYSTAFASDILLPPSYAYLICYADSIRTNGSHLAIAGTTRGYVNGYKSPSIPATEKLSNAVADSWQDLDSAINVNGITYIRNYGYCIWGTRTLYNNQKKGGLTDSSFLNIRNMLCDIKKRIRNVAVRLLFEQNNDVLWSRFLFGVSPIFERLKATAGITGYKIIKEPCADKTKLKATIKIVTIKPLEQVEVAIVMTDEDVAVE